MSNPIHGEMDTVSLIQNISERQNIIEKYRKIGELDRKDAITKILKLRGTDREVLLATSARLALSATPFEQCSDEQIIAELKMQAEILIGKLKEKNQEENRGITINNNY